MLYDYHLTGKIFLAALFLAGTASFAAAGEKTTLFPSESYTDIFISSQKADITITPQTEGKSSLSWKPRLCEVSFNRPSEAVAEITIKPRKQNSFLKKILMIPRSRCSVNLRIGENKHIYASSRTGDIRFFNLTSPAARAYTEQGVIENFNGGGIFSAETLTDRITIKNFDGKALNLKTVSGNIFVGATAKDISLLNTNGNTKTAATAENLMFYSSQGNLNAKWNALPQTPIRISAHSFSGNIKISLPKAEEEYKKNTKIDLKTFYGNASVEEK